MEPYLLAIVDVPHLSMQVSQERNAFIQIDEIRFVAGSSLFEHEGDGEPYALVGVWDQSTKRGGFFISFCEPKLPGFLHRSRGSKLNFGRGDLGAFSSPSVEPIDFSAIGAQK